MMNSKTLKCFGLLLLIMMLSVSCPLLAQDDATSPEKAAPDDPERVLATFGDKQLKAWQVDVMMENELGHNLAEAVNAWIDIQARLYEANRLKMDQSRESKFILDLHRDNYLGTMLKRQIKDKLAKPTEEQMRKKYEEDKVRRYTRPYTVNLQHITVIDRKIAEEIIEKAKQPGQDFTALYEQHSITKNANKGKVNFASHTVIKAQIGQEAADALKTAKPGEIFGPFMGRRGFEVVKVYTVRPEEVTPFEKVKDRIEQLLLYENDFIAQRDLLISVKSKIPITKSMEVKQSEVENSKLRPNGNPMFFSQPPKMGPPPMGPPPMGPPPKK